MADDKAPSSSICTIKMDINCCQKCPLKLEKKLLKSNGMLFSGWRSHHFLCLVFICIPIFQNLILLLDESLDYVFETFQSSSLSSQYRTCIYPYVASEFSPFICEFTVVGVESVTIDPNKGLVTILGDIDPLVLLQKIKAMGKEAKLWFFQKEPGHDDEATDRSKSASKIEHGSIESGSNNEDDKQFDWHAQHKCLAACYVF
ncbi:uncharacterized protein LOC120084626 [Benincasa hispida]|uniref:uncharacterized protein LOC120084626 n=1 Tax=Benincasa hispida TaxID=102211 RepID=UPI00190031E0|nr:uncharacterized protein LOC120084626 [Benincasa hispida]